MRAPGAFVILLAMGCTESVPDAPSWTRDVRPILVANCVRCHSDPPIGGAPRAFRLDVHEFKVRDDGSVVLGAGAMSEFIAARVSADQMPPRFPLSERQKDVLEAWHAAATPGMGAPAGEVRAENSDPIIERLGEVEITEGFLDFNYRVSDPDRDVVTGALFAELGSERLRITRELESGRGSARWDVGSVAEGSYEIVASLSDGISTVERSLGAARVSRGENSAPTVEFLSSLRDALFSHENAPAEILVEIDDVDASDTLALTLEAVVADERVTLAEMADAPRGENAVPIDVSALEPRRRWRFVATVSDGSDERSEEAGPITVGAGATDLGFGDVRDLLIRNCAPCHPGSGSISRVPGVAFSIDTYDDVFNLRGSIYRRAVDERTMPPVSAESIFEIQMNAEERELLGEWLLAGAPE